MSDGILGIHHVTALAGDPQQNLDFYAGVLGMRLVKRSVNQDMPDTYHLFYADAEGHPGTDLTFFPIPHSAPARYGVGLGSEISLAVPPGSLVYWAERLSEHGIAFAIPPARFGEPVLTLTDPHGLPLALIETGDAREFAAWEGSPVPAERQVRGLHAVRLLVSGLTPTADLLTGVLGFTHRGEEDGWHRYGVAGGGSGAHVEVRAEPETPRGEWGAGAMHHVAWRVADDAAELAVRERIAAARRRPTEVIDRFWFKSVYFTEPGGVLFELATDGPGFAVDETPETLGERLVLPPWLEPHRSEIEAGLLPLRLPEPALPNANDAGGAR